MWILDAGAGGTPRYPFRPQVTGENVICLDVQRPVVKIENFVMADVQFLPFKDNCFRLVFASHVLEHVPDPTLALEELLRVCHHQTEIRVPHPKHPSAWRDPSHLWTFNSEWFEKSLPYHHLTITETKKEIVVTVLTIIQPKIFLF